MAQDSVDAMKDGMEQGADIVPAPPPSCLLTDADVEQIACAVIGKLVVTACASWAAAVNVWKGAGGGNGT